MSEKRIVTLTLTNSCNLNCVYCYENNKSSKEMSFDTAKQIIDNEFLINDGSDIEFDLFGGEPFLRFDLIKQIYNYLATKYKNERWLVFVTTNGTKVHGEIKEWIRGRINFYCGLSLDGTKYMHDINRSNSFDDIDIDFFLEQYPNQGVKMTVSEKTLPFLAEGVIYLHKLGFPVDCNLAYGIDWSNKENEEILKRELMKLINFYLENPNIKPCKMLDYKISGIGMYYEKPELFTRKWCGTGTKMHTYDVDGRSFPCQFFMPLSVGEEKAIASKEINFLDEIPFEKIEEKCRRCAYISACPTCYGANYCATGDIYKKDDGYCKLVKITIEAVSYFKAKQWEKGLLNLSKSEEILLLKAIKVIQNEMKNKGE